MLSLLVALIWVVGVADFLPHNDDGCVVEVHCLTCRVHMGALSDIATAPVGLLSVRELVGFTVKGAQTRAYHTTSFLPPGRAPPVSV